MGCSECGEKPKTCNKDFTKSVIEIDNPAEIILFHKMLIPASMGDESQTPVTVGKYKNVLMVYEANGHAYLYSSDGIPSKIAFDSGGILFVENLPDVSQASVGFLYITRTGSAAITNDNEEWVTLGGEDTIDFNVLSNRPKYAGVEMTGDTNIPSVEAETSARIEADNSLSSSINSLSSSLSSEAEARAAADTTLQNNIDSLVIGDGVITFTENNVVKGTFSANATENKTIEFPVPTQTSQLTNNGSDGTSTYVETKDLPTVDTVYDSASNNAIANSTVTNSLDRDVMTNLALDTNPSTTTINLSNTKTNLATPSSTTTSSISLPVASSTQAGVMNAAMYDALTKNTQDIANIIGEVVAITGLSANPTQAELTTAWLNASGEPALINGAGIYDVTNTKRWTYYSNDTTWYALDATGSVTVNPWSNTAAGIVKGSTNVGQIFAENDGTGSVNGWDTLSGQVSTNTSKLATIEQGAEVNVQSDWDETVTTADDYIKNKPQNLVQDAAYVHTDNNFTTSLKNKLDGITVNDATLTIQNDGVNVETFTANSATNKTANIVPPVKIGSVISQPSSVTYVGTNNIIDGAVTSTKIADGTISTVDIANGAVTSAKIADGTISTVDIANLAVTMDKIDFSGLKNISGFPIAAYNMRNAGGDTELDLIRVGNLVIASGTFVTQGIGAYDEIDIGNVVPSGYRPTSLIPKYSTDGVWVPFATTTGSPVAAGGWTIFPNGTMKFSNAPSVTGAHRYAYDAAYITTDNWPS